MIRTLLRLLLLTVICFCSNISHRVDAFHIIGHTARRSGSGALSTSSLNRRRTSRTCILMGNETDPLLTKLGNDWKNEKNSSPSSQKDDSLIDSFTKWFRSDDGKEDIKVYLISLFIALLIRFTIIEPRYIPSLSMYPTFEVGDQLAVEKVTKRINPLYRNEVVVFNPPQRFRDIVEGEYGDSARSKEALIKRIVAVAGDRVQVTKGKLYINGEQADEPFVAEEAEYEFGPVVVPPGHVLVLGDNRNHSLDGHIWGFLPKDNVIGRAVFVYWPPWRIGNNAMY